MLTTSCFSSRSLSPQADTVEAVSQLVAHVRHLLGTVLDRDKVLATGDQIEASPTARDNQRQVHERGACSQELSRVTQAAVSLVLPAAQHQLDVRGLVDGVLQAVQDFPQVTCDLWPCLLIVTNRCV